MTRFFTPFRLVLLAALALTVAAGFALVPAGTVLPVHWNINGEADGFLPREWAILWPAIIVALVWTIFITVDRFMTAEQREAGAYIMSVVLTVLTATFLGIAAATVAIGLGLPVSMVQVVAVAMGLLLLVLGNAMPKSRPNGYAGIRMPSTLRSETNWLATHRLGGWLSIAGGLILLVAAFTVPATHLLWWVIGCIVLPMLIASGYSLWLARRTA
jgi:uncharacterized membrane protein